MFKTSKKYRNERALLESAWKVYHYRKDLWSAAQAHELLHETQALEQLLAQASPPAEALSKAFRKVDGLLRHLGKTIYPFSPWVENVETFLVAAVLAIGIRIFFFQPFAIPTDSMYPTYSGMRPFVYTQAAPRPGALLHLLGKLLWWKQSYTLTSPVEGNLQVPLFAPHRPRPSGGGIMAYRVVACPRFFIFKTLCREYTFKIDKESVRLRVPLDFSLDEVFAERYFSYSGSFVDAFMDFYREASLRKGIIAGEENLWAASNIQIKKGEAILDFDLGVGDMLFVDRLSYHFRSPRIGEPIVIETNKVPALRDNKYYIKRLVAQGQDTLRVQDGVLLRNGKPIEGAEAFEKNARKEGLYFGYTQDGRLAEGKIDLIPPDHYYGMGDHSRHSGDSRRFGPVPKKAVIGKALFIYYPFSQRWGLAR